MCGCSTYDRWAVGAPQHPKTGGWVGHAHAPLDGRIPTYGVVNVRKVMYRVHMYMLYDFMTAMYDFSMISLCMKSGAVYEIVSGMISR